MSYISFEDVQKIYQMGEVTIHAVDGVNFHIEKGEFAIIVGPSGAGKTTVLNMLGGMDACSGGVIQVDGALVSNYNSRQLTTYRRHDIGFVFQFYNLVQNLTALENVELAAQICKNPLRRKFWNMSDLATGSETFLHSFPEVNSSVWRSHEHWQRIRNCFSAMNRQEHLIM